MEPITGTPTQAPHTSSTLHLALAHSYLSYFIFSLLGLFADTFITGETPLPHGQDWALMLFITGSLLIWWAQYTSAVKNDKPYFERGPYRFLRNPTHIGILLLVTGYAVVSGSVVFLGVTLIGYLVSNVFFKKYESILHREYGSQYTEYKDTVPKIF
jgi:protein-S-isoprenylcysteine O-methyltransferase Ste14